MLFRNKKALSPVIASIILIAVTVAVAVVTAAWMGGISIGLMGNVEQAKITNVEFLSSPANSAKISILNSGSSSVTLQSAYLDGNSVSMATTEPTNSLTVDKGTSANVIITNSGSFASGTQYTIKIITEKGNALLFAVEAIPSAVSSNNGWIGDGSDGQLVVSSVNQVVNGYAYLTGNENAGETTITVNDASGFSRGDEILFVQIQNSSGGEAGIHEFKIISSISGNDITLTASLENGYFSGNFNKIGATATQIVRVPQYTTVTVNSGSSIGAPAWDGYTGGIVVFRAETVTINNGGKIDVSEKGYRGGAYGPNNNIDGFQGESYGGKGIGGSSYGLGKMNNKGGGGSYICGGGGEYAGGATNSEPWTGSGDTYARKGETYGTADLTQIFFGSGGGGQWNGNNPNPSNGGTGGGIIIICANSIIASTDSFLSNGKTTSGIQYGSYSYGSSGGAGGSIYLYATTIQGETNFCRAIGGLGNHLPIRDGGDGGVGRIRLDYTTLTGSTTPSAGYTGSVP